MDKNMSSSQEDNSLKRKLSSTNRCIGCNEDIGKNNPRQYCCKGYCPNLEEKQERENKILECKTLPKSDLVSIIKDGKIVGYFDNHFCKIDKPIDVNIVKILMRSELSDLKNKIDSLAFYKSNESDIETELQLETMNIRVRTKYTIANIRYNSLMRCYKYILNLEGMCEYRDEKRCICFKKSCLQCCYRKHISSPIFWENELDSREYKLI